MKMSVDRKAVERDQLTLIIRQWNDNRLDLFELSEPNEDLEFHGVMRFYFQDAGQKVATKCIRVSSTASSKDVIQTLIEKFHPDFRMLSVPEYALYEVHESGEERKLSEEEKPLLVQLNWHKDDREGRFLLRRMDETTYLPGLERNNINGSSFNRRVSKKKKKEKKKRERKDSKDMNGIDKDGLASRLYTEKPETSFTRSISNPEAVMRRRRQQKLEKKLQLLCKEGGPDAGGTLRIFGESLNKDVPYKTLLLSTKDTTMAVVKDILNKYGKDREDPSQFCLVQLIVPHEIGDNVNDAHIATAGIKQHILDDDDCPLLIEKQHNKARGTLTFHIKRRPADFQPRKRKKKPEFIKGELDAGYNAKYDEMMDKLPYLDVNSKTDSETLGSISKSVSGSNHVLNVEQPVSNVDNRKQHEQYPQGVEVAVIKLQKSNNCMGLSIVAAKGANQDKLGIYIKSVVKSGAADLDGRLQAGDQLLSVDGHSLIGISQERAAELISQTGSVVTLEVAKQAAIFYGLGVLLNQQSPLVPRTFSILREKHPQQQPANVRRTAQMSPVYNANTSRPNSQLSMQSQPHHRGSYQATYPEERHYQNISMYLMHPNNGYQNAESLSTSQQRLHQQPHQQQHQPQHQHQLSAHSPMQQQQLPEHHQQLNYSHHHLQQLQQQQRLQQQQQQQQQQQTQHQLPVHSPMQFPEHQLNPAHSHLLQQQLQQQKLQQLQQQQQQLQQMHEHQQQLNHSHHLQQLQQQRMQQQQQQLQDQNKQLNHSHQLQQLQQQRLQQQRLQRLRLEELRRHQELQITQQAEERLLREAKRRQEEEPRHQRPPQLRFELPNNQHNEDIPPPLPKSPPPVENNAQQRLDRLLLSTVAANSNGVLPIRNAKSKEVNPVPKPTKVSWQEPSPTPTPTPTVLHLETNASSNGPMNVHSFTLQDIDEVLDIEDDPEFNMGFTAGNTPNVIGAQEVYRDPRERIKAEKMRNEAQKGVQPVPEKLSFKEKMKMFAKEQDTPKDKVKISKAQREIETAPSPGKEDGDEQLIAAQEVHS